MIVAALIFILEGTALICFAKPIAAVERRWIFEFFNKASCVPDERRFMMKNRIVGFLAIAFACIMPVRSCGS